MYAHFHSLSHTHTRTHTHTHTHTGLWLGYIAAVLIYIIYITVLIYIIFIIADTTSYNTKKQKQNGTPGYYGGIGSQRSESRTGQPQRLLPDIGTLQTRRALVPANACSKVVVYQRTCVEKSPTGLQGLQGTYISTAHVVTFLCSKEHV